MHKIENMIVFGGTHGNEFTGVEVIKLLEKRNYFGKNLNLYISNKKPPSRWFFFLNIILFNINF